MDQCVVDTSLDIQETRFHLLVGQDNLLEVLQGELDHIDLIRNIWPIQWNRNV